MSDINLMDELLAQGGMPMQQGEPLTDGPPMPGSGDISQLRPLVQNPLDDFVMTILEFGDKYGVLDSAMSPDDPESMDIDQRLEALSTDMLDLLSKNDIDLLISKFEALSPEQQTMIMQTIQEESPELYQELMKFFRMARGKDNTWSRGNGQR